MASVQKVRGGPLSDGTFVEFERGFRHQVAGHDQIFKGFGGLLCKPIIPREAWYYLEALPNAPAEYTSFAPQCFGKVGITHDEWLLLHAQFVSPGPSKAAGSSPMSPISSSGQAGAKGSAPKENGAACDYTNPWAEKMHAKHVRRTLRSGRRTHQYLVLEDLTHEMIHPCALDVKMGKRQYGDDATEAKKASMAIKCANSTSGLFGFRLSGYQAWDVKQQEYRLLEKYQGRDLDEEGLLAQVRDFVFDGEEVRQDIVDAFLEQLRRLEALIRRHRVFRIYSTSLLLIYDGHREHDEHPPCVHVKMIDFAHIETYSPGDPDDDGYLDGLGNLIRFFTRC